MDYLYSDFVLIASGNAFAQGQCRVWDALRVLRDDMNSGGNFQWSNFCRGSSRNYVNSGAAAGSLGDVTRGWRDNLRLVMMPVNGWANVPPRAIRTLTV
jgi:hypothetical protein